MIERGHMGSNMLIIFNKGTNIFIEFLSSNLP